MANLTQGLFEQIGTVLDTIPTIENYPFRAPEYATYPCIVYNMIASSKADETGSSFDAETETFLVQISVFNNDLDDTDLFDIQADIEDAIKDTANWNDLLRVQYLGGNGPLVSSVKGYRQYDKTFAITLGQDKI